MRFRNNIAALGTLLAFGLSACSGGGGTSSGPLPQEPSNPGNTSPVTSSSTASYTLSSAAASYTIPAVGGYTGSYDFPAAPVPPDTILTVTSALPGASDSLSLRREHPESAGQFNIYIKSTMSVSKTVTMPGFPGITFTLPSIVNTSGLQFFYAIQKVTPNPGTIETFRTEGPAIVTGHTIKVPADLVPLTLKGGFVFQVELYSISPVLPPQGQWIANGTNVLEFVQQVLPLGFNNVVPAAEINSSVFGAPQGVQFDVAGDLWVIDGGAGGKPPSLYAFTPAQLAALHTNNHPSPAITLRSSKFKFIQQAVFDTSNDLWVTDNGNNALYEFTPAQLTAGGANVPPHTTVISSPAFIGPLGLAFSPKGPLWIANNGSTTLYRFDKLPSSGVHTLAPNVILSDNGKGSIQGPWALVFDAAGNMWSSNANAPNTVVEFAASSIKVSGKPNPAVTISPTLDSGFTTLVSPNGLAFDNAGDLAAVSSLSPFGVPIYGPAQILTSGKLTPDVFIVGGKTTLNAPAGNEFGPLH